MYQSLIIINNQSITSNRILIGLQMSVGVSLTLLEMSTTMLDCDWSVKKNALNSSDMTSH